MSTLVLALLCFVTAFGQKSKPNFVVILTDDQDITLDSMEVMNKTKTLIVNQGMTFTNGFVSTPICCVTRSSIMSGRYVHNHGVRNNSYDGGCTNSTWQKNIEPHCFAPHLEAAGYQTFYAGKYLNLYGQGQAGGVEYIPPGWSDWFGLVGNSKYYNYSISNNGMKQSFGGNYSTDYYTNVLKEQGLSFLKKLPANPPPFFLMIGTPSAHAPFTPAPQYNNTNAGQNAPRIPNWNNVKIASNKHLLMQQTPQMDNTSIYQSDASYRYRHGTLMSVDDLVEALYNQIEAMGVMDNTYFLYTSDHGFHSGEYAMGYDKRQLYENDIRIPYYWKGPGIAKGVKTDMIALNIDIAATVVDIAVGTVPPDFDGRSVAQYLFNDEYHYKGEKDRDGTVAAGVKQQFLIEYYGESWSQNPDGLSCCGGYPGFKCAICDSWNNTYSCVRGIDGSKNEVNGTQYCQFKCFGEGYVEVPCMDGTAQGDGEYYELETDFYELNNAMSSLSPNAKNEYESMRMQFLNCAGQTECNKLRDGTSGFDDGIKFEYSDRNTIPFDQVKLDAIQNCKHTITESSLV